MTTNYLNSVQVFFNPRSSPPQVNSADHMLITLEPLISHPIKSNLLPVFHQKTMISSRIWCSEMLEDMSPLSERLRRERRLWRKLLGSHTLSLPLPSASLSSAEISHVLSFLSREKGLDINSEEIQKILHEYDPPSPQEQASKLKEKGNVAFKECDYAQASLFYSQAIEILENIVTDSTQGDNASEEYQKLAQDCKEVLCTIYSNRAACALKLGDHELALSDTNSCLQFDSENVKANFRKGLALHALGRYREACPVLGFALKKEPKNQQIKSALLFAERKAAMPNSK
jgi:tetratricopeptide (TPR) repeat protein